MIINLINGDEELISFDSGFYFGKGLFETILIKDNKPVFYKEHLRRLNEGLKTLEINRYIDEKIFFQNIRGCNDCAIKVMVSENNIIFSKRVVPYKKEDYEKGFSLKLSNVLRNETSPMVYLKSFNYMDNIVEKQKAKKEGFNEVIFLNTKGEIAEGAVSNIFFIMEDRIITPKVECGILDGIVRRGILEELGEVYNIFEDIITLDDLNKCQGIFITNSLLGVMWVNSFNEVFYEKHNIYNEIKTEYDRLVIARL